MKKLLHISIILSILLMNALTVFGQSASLVAVVSDDDAIMIKVSDNGLWAAGYFEESII